jgi:hypothetical protein
MTVGRRHARRPPAGNCAPPNASSRCDSLSANPTAVGRGPRTRAGDAARRLAHRPRAPSRTSSCKPSDREIQRLNRLTNVVIVANLTKGTTMDEVRKRVEPVMAGIRCRRATRGNSAAASTRTTRHPDHVAEHAARGSS